jgi:hypothetical protein
MSVNVAEGWEDPDRVFFHLKGEWELYRRVDGRDLMEGRATFTPDVQGNLAYHERGRFRTLDGQQIEAERKYVFVAEPRGFSVYFAEMPLRLFHEIRLEAVEGCLVGRADHHCVADIYRSRYAFLPDGRFTVEHEVSGPSKDYVLSTSFARRRV